MNARELKDTLLHFFFIFYCLGGGDFDKRNSEDWKE